jgi:hypothetical protein
MSGYIVLPSGAGSPSFAPSVTATVVAYGPTPPPTLTAINIDFASANGGESRILTGTNLSNATVKVDGNAATVTANTATSITFTVPASSVSSTSGNSSVSAITVTTPGGTATTSGAPGNSLWYLPKYFGVANVAAYTGQNVTTSGGNIATVPDQSGNGYTLTPQSSAPAYTSAGATSYWSTTGAPASNSGVLIGSGYPAIAATSTFEWFIIARASNVTNNNDHVLASLSGTPSAAAFYVDQFGTENDCFQSSSGSVANYVALTANAWFDICSLFNNSTTSQQVLNGGTPATGTNPGSSRTPTGGIAVGGAYSGIAAWAGDIAMAIAYYGGVPGGATGRANLHAYAVAEGFG